MRLERQIAMALLGSAAMVFAQNAPRPEFEVATIRPTGDVTQGQVAAGVHIDGAQVRWAALTLKDYIGAAYRVRVYQITGPDWIGSERFNIAATLPPGSTPDQIPDMMQALLAERFGLKLRREKKEFSVYALEVAKDGLKMKEAAPDPAEANADPRAGVTVTGAGSAQGVSVNLGRGSSYTFGNNRFDAKKLTMQTLAGNLERFVDRPIVDTTNLTGAYDFALDVTPEDYQNMLIHAAVAAGVVLPPQALRLLDVGPPASLFEALQKLGLRLDARKAPLDFFVVEEARKTPTDN